jgi:hypothetical protein
LPRAYIKSRFVFVRPQPDANRDWIGFLWFGASVALRSGDPVRGRGCASFYAIEPAGYICVDGKQATLDPGDATYQAVKKFAPQLDQAEPHAYGESLGAERARVVAQAPLELPELPASFHETRRQVLPLSTVAYVREPRLSASDWLLTADLLWVPRARVTPYPEVTFHGIELGETALPVAFFRKEGALKYRKDETGKLRKSDATFALHALVPLDAEPQVQHGERYFRVRGADDYVREIEAVLPSPQTRTPWNARVGEEDRTGRAPKNARHTWLEVSVQGGWLIAYEGTRAVYATLVSPGRGGLPAPGVDPLVTAATPLGTFPISGKLATITLESPGEYVHADVPWTQNFEKPYAIHTAYWHDNWGNPQSGGCINVSPIDGKWLFEFSEPALPEGWHAVRWRPELGAPTILVIHQ